MTMTAQMTGALHWIASRGEMRVGTYNDFMSDQLSSRTAWALERRGLVERRWTGAEDGYVYITDKGKGVEAKLLDDVECPKCGEEVTPAPLWECDNFCFSNATGASVPRCDQCGDRMERVGETYGGNDEYVVACPLCFETVE